MEFRVEKALQILRFIQDNSEIRDELRMLKINLFC